LLQDYRDQFIAYRKVCEQLGLKKGTSENGSSNILKRMKIDNPTPQEKEEAKEKAIEEHHMILFMLGADKYKYGKLIEDMKNEVLRKKDPFLKLLQRRVIHCQNGRIATEGNTTTIKMNQMMVLPSQQ